MSEDPAFLINHALRSKGLASLSEGPALVAQLAMFVRDDRHFRALINTCEPQERGNMYNALAPNVRFKARPLSDYLIEIAQDAERQQLPTLGPKGELQEFKTAVINNPDSFRIEPPTDAAIATNAIAEAVAKQRLHVVCLLCTREDVFRGVTKEEAVEALRAAGWRAGSKYVGEGEEREQVEICPRCVKSRAPRMRAA
ncbi:MAG: hypothetical protein V4502_08030 [Pseudomonadota bacterium]